jgi:general secretion pathway protein G
MQLTNETVHTRRRKNALRGMSLLEIMVVITLIGLVTAVIGVSVMRVLVNNQAKVAHEQALELEKSLEVYRLEKGKLPTQDRGLVALTDPPPIVNKLPADPWGNAFRYERPGAHNASTFDIRSAGPDGAFGTDDDVGNWDIEEHD